MRKNSFALCLISWMDICPRDSLFPRIFLHPTKKKKQSRAIFFRECGAKSMQCQNNAFTRDTNVSFFELSLDLS